GMSGVNLNVACGKEVNPPSMTGMVAGFVNSGGFIGAALLQPLFGLILDRNWQGAVENGVRVYPLSAYQNAFWWCTVVLGLGVLFTCLIKETGGVNICLAKQIDH
ncbi:MAG TPA: MFS transporter, partial [Bacillota bacterium]|nr:MFS transporter [Bacillota bacterium]